MVRKLLWINGIAVLGVLLFHATGWGFVAMFAWSSRYRPAGTPDYALAGSFSYYLLRLIQQLVVFVIPAFLFVSGYFIAVATGREHQTIGWKLIGNRIKWLLIPYVIWSVAIWLLKALEGQTLSPLGYVEALVTGRTNPAYYYVPLLISMYVLAPILVFWAKKHWRLLLLCAAVLQLTVQLLYYPALLAWDLGPLQPFVDRVPRWFFPARIFWFTFGIVAGFHITQFSLLLRRYQRQLITAAVIFYLLGVVEWEAIIALSGQVGLDHRETLIDTLLSLTILLGVMAADVVQLWWAATMSALSSKTYGIYLVHSPVMEVVARLIYGFVPALLAYQIVLQPLLVLFGLGIPLLLMFLLSRSPWRRYYRYVFG